MGETSEVLATQLQELGALEEFRSLFSDPSNLKSLDIEPSYELDHEICDDKNDEDFSECLPKFPTHPSIGLGEMSHPMTIANLAASHLRLASMPISQDALAKIVLLGESYERDWQALQQNYTVETLMVVKISDELEIKQRFIESMFGLLYT